MDTRATWGLTEWLCARQGIWVWEPLGADICFEGTPQEDAGEIWFDSTPLRRRHFLGGPQTKEAKHGKPWFGGIRKGGA